MKICPQVLNGFRRRNFLARLDAAEIFPGRNYCGAQRAS